MMQGTTQHLRDIIAEVNPSIQLAAADFDKSIADAGIDSLDFSYVLLRVEETLGVKITDEESQKLGSLKALCTLIDAKKSA